MNDAINHPSHYTSGPEHTTCGQPIECIDITEQMNFNLGNAIKYLWRADHKGSPLEDLAKARWYVDREIQRRQPEGVYHANFAPCGTCATHPEGADQ